MWLSEFDPPGLTVDVERVEGNIASLQLPRRARPYPPA
jgi:hypothetical protein